MFLFPTILSFPIVLNARRQRDDRRGLEGVHLGSPVPGHGRRKGEGIQADARLVEAELGGKLTSE